MQDNSFTMSPVFPDPEAGEWLTADTVERIEELVRTITHDYAEVFNHLPDLKRPTAVEAGSPHGQECVEEQRGDLCAWVAQAARSRLCGVLERDIRNAEFRCTCVAGGQLLKGGVRELGDGRYEVGWVRTAS